MKSSIPDTLFAATEMTGANRPSSGGATRLSPSLPEGGKRSLPVALGFRDGNGTVHTSRTMMLAELTLALEHVGPSAKQAEYISAITEQNVLGKATRTTRKRTADRLIELYTLDANLPIFRCMRHFWPADPSARPMLAFMAAVARDILLREMTPFVLAIPVGAAVRATDITQHMQEKYPGRFRPTTLLSTAQNLASSWTQAGYLAGKINKKRCRPIVTPVATTFVLLLGYLCGLRGKMLLDTTWTRMLNLPAVELTDLATEASKQGWLNFKAAGAVVEITFSGILTPQEERATHVQD